MKRIAWIVLAWMSLLTTAHAASFDCARASTKTEKMICSDVELSRLDEDLNAVYKNALHNENQSVALINSQKQWIRERNGCMNPFCIRSAYSSRISHLASVKTEEMAQTSNVIKSDFDACRVIASHFNSGTEKTLLVPPTAAHAPKELIAIFGTDGPYWSVDLDDDGILDHLVITDEGTMHIKTVHVLPGKKGATASLINAFTENEDDILLDLEFYRVGGRHYINWQGGYWHLSKTGEFQSACQFKQLSKPVLKLNLGKENQVCSKIKPDKIQHVDYNLEHHLDELPDEERFWSITPKEGLALVDIDNDGRPDNVVRLDFIHGAGRGCGVTYIAVTDDTRTEIPDSKLNKLLLEELGGYPCGPNLNVFVLDGITYIDANSGYQVYLIKADKAKKVCEFQWTRSVIEAIDASK